MWGVDISNHQAGADLAKAKAGGVGFVIAKATEGLTYTDPQFRTFRAAARKIGLTFGAYHYARPAPARSPTAEADAFLAVAAGADLYALDIETAAGMASTQIAAWALAWLRRVQQRTAHSPYLYTYRTFADWTSQPALAGYPLWLAAPGDTTPAPIRPWRHVSIVQDSWSAVVPGFARPVDHDVILAPAPPHPPPSKGVPTMCVGVYGRSVYYLLTGGRIVWSISKTAYDEFISAGIPHVALPTADVDLLRRSLTTSGGAP